MSGYDHRSLHVRRSCCFCCFPGKQAKNTQLFMLQTCRSMLTILYHLIIQDWKAEFPNSVSARMFVKRSKTSEKLQLGFFHLPDLAKNAATKSKMQHFYTFGVKICKKTEASFSVYPPINALVYVKGISFDVRTNYLQLTAEQLRRLLLIQAMRSNTWLMCENVPAVYVAKNWLIGALNSSFFIIIIIYWH